MDEFIAPRGWLLPLEPLEELHTHQETRHPKQLSFDVSAITGKNDTSILRLVPTTHRRSSSPDS